MYKFISFPAAVATLATIVQLPLLSPANAQMSDMEFQMGRAREACQNQAKTQGLSVNNVVSTTPVNGSGGRMIGSEVILSVTRKGATYRVKCNYDNSSRRAQISSVGQSGKTGVVNVNSLNVRREPNTNAKIIYSAPQGTVMSILGERAVGDSVWYRVKKVSSSVPLPPIEGWVFGRYLTIR